MDSVVLEQAHKDNRNLYIANIDYRKTFDSVPHSWLIHVLRIYKTDPQIYYVFFWVFPRRLIVVCRRFGTLYRFHLQGLDVYSTSSP